MKRIAALTCAAALLALAGCGPSGNDTGPGGVSVDEAEALDQAAEMIEARRLPEDALAKEALPAELRADAPVELAPENGADTPSSEPAEDE